MSDIAALVRTSLPASVRIEERPGLSRLAVDSARGTGEAALPGAHVTAWHPASSRRPVLWTSRRSLFEPGRAIRGGVPICFPWFGPHGGDASAPTHGFARLRPWTLVEAREDADGTVSLEMELRGEAGSPQWRHRFAVTYRVTFGAALRMELVVRNAGVARFTFEEALHAYFGVADVRHVTVAGLEGAADARQVAGLGGGPRARRPSASAARPDRIYLEASSGARLVRDAPGRAQHHGREDGLRGHRDLEPVDRQGAPRCRTSVTRSGWTMVCVESATWAARVDAGARRAHTMTALVEAREEGPAENS